MRRIVLTETLLLATCLFAAPAPLAAQAPQREARVTVYGDDPCPTPADPEEIVVCARRPEEERYRIPQEFRRGRPTEVSWGARATELEDAQRDTRPDSCSVVGAFGQSGCTRQWIDQWVRERRQGQSSRR